LEIYLYQQDELVWAAAWLHRASRLKKYLDYLGGAGDTGGARTMFSWDDKYVGAQILVAKVFIYFFYKGYFLFKLLNFINNQCNRVQGEHSVDCVDMEILFI
jgi:hypothetical protein